jgi:hypothetical protein
VAGVSDCSCTPTSIVADLGGQTVTPGCYTPDAAAALALTGSVTLNGAGRYVFKTAAALNTAANSVVVLTNGAVCSNVLWCVASAATIGATSAFEGTIQITGPAGGAGAASGGAITIGAASTVHGALNALVVNIGDAVSITPCGAPVSSSGAGAAANCQCAGAVQQLTNADLGGQTLAPGCYAPTSAGAFALTGTLTLSGAGDYLFTTPAALNTAANSNVALTGGATCDRVSWCIGGAATLGATSTFNGHLVTTSIDAPITTGDSVHMHGTVLAGNDVINYGARTIVLPCGVGDFSTLVDATVPGLSSGAAPQATAPVVFVTAAAAIITALYAL